MLTVTAFTNEAAGDLSYTTFLFVYVLHLQNNSTGSCTLPNM